MLATVLGWRSPGIAPTLVRSLVCRRPVHSSAACTSAHPQPVAPGPELDPGAVPPGPALSIGRDLSLDFRSFIRSIASPVTVVSAADALGNVHGATVSSFMSISLEPPIISFSLSDRPAERPPSDFPLEMVDADRVRAAGGRLSNILASLRLAAGPPHQEGPPAGDQSPFFAINLLAADQDSATIAEQLARPARAGEHLDHEWLQGVACPGSALRLPGYSFAPEAELVPLPPLLRRSAASLICERLCFGQGGTPEPMADDNSREEILRVGDHTVWFGRVVGVVRNSPGHPGGGESPDAPAGADQLVALPSDAGSQAGQPFDNHLPLVYYSRVFQTTTPL
ncbi:hypothetical protein H696_02344 [Fonticula alba]|uniref:Flavin reductase like domain-containing protein n=1 Tax=Fonticula alba TaxID=691883 RepID=A0A058ZBU0_FONAL|nr:hypothetical protein H696_02344 [Fonticula alba]KCV71396.1 hypothetical protein H696_02344 [Fonticula alba]|eukprot:XP_009494519.1 hypothetical protein H696_02344 [Fonticula alba]